MAAPIDAPKAAPPIPSPRRVLWTRIATLAAAALVLLAIAYGIGRAQGARALARSESAARETQARMARGAQETRTQLERRLAAVEVEFARAQRMNAALESRRQLGLAMLSMDDRNFGIAQGQIEAARTSLRGAMPFDEAGLAEVQPRLAGVTIVAAADFADQRAGLVQIAHAFDAQLGAAVPPR